MQAPYELNLDPDMAGQIFQVSAHEEPYQEKWESNNARNYYTLLPDLTA